MFTNTLIFLKPPLFSTAACVMIEAPVSCSPGNSLQEEKRLPGASRDLPGGHRELVSRSMWEETYGIPTFKTQAANQPIFKTWQMNFALSGASVPSRTLWMNNDAVFKYFCEEGGARRRSQQSVVAEEHWDGDGNPRQCLCAGQIPHEQFSPSKRRELWRSAIQRE